MFRILSIDGGGVRGVYPAHFLALFTAKYGSLTNIFDLIIGTSTGAIVASAAAMNEPMTEVVSMYESRAGEIFAKKRFALKGILRSKYRSAPIEHVLRQLFEDKTMADVPGRLIPALHRSLEWKRFVIKSPYLGSFVRDSDIRLVDAVRASCAAPLYFDPVRVKEYLLADGGLWENNPSIIAYTEAVGKLGVSRDDVRILSLGTGTGQQYYDPGARPWSWGLSTGWKRTQLIDTILNLQSTVSTNMTTLLLQGLYRRVSFEESCPLPLDDVSSIPRLKAKAGQAFTYQHDSIKAFLQL